MFAVLFQTTLPKYLFTIRVTLASIYFITILILPKSDCISIEMDLGITFYHNSRFSYSIDVRHRRDTAAPPFGSWKAWIGLVIGASRCMHVIPLGRASLIFGRSWQTLASFLSQFCKDYTKIVAGEF